MIVPLKYLSNFWRTLEMPLINCETNFILTWSEKCFIISNAIAGQVPTFAISDTKLYVLVVIISNQDNAKLLEQLKLGLKRTLNWNKYQSKVATQVPKQYLDCLTDPIFRE